MDRRDFLRRLSRGFGSLLVDQRLSVAQVKAQIQTRSLFLTVVFLGNGLQ